MGGARHFRVHATSMRRRWKARRARVPRADFSGVESLGWSTLVQIVAASDADRAVAAGAIAGAKTGERFWRAGSGHGAHCRRGRNRLRAVAVRSTEESTIIAMHRTDDDGEIRETFRSLAGDRGAEASGARFAFLEVEGEGDDETPADEVDLVQFGQA